MATQQRRRAGLLGSAVQIALGEEEREELRDLVVRLGVGSAAELVGLAARVPGLAR